MRVLYKNKALIADMSFRYRGRCYHIDKRIFLFLCICEKKEKQDKIIYLTIAVVVFL